MRECLEFNAEPAFCFMICPPGHGEPPDGQHIVSTFARRVTVSDPTGNAFPDNLPIGHTCDEREQVHTHTYSRIMTSFPHSIFSNCIFGFAFSPPTQAWIQNIRSTRNAHPKCTQASYLQKRGTSNTTQNAYEMWSASSSSS